MFLHEDGSIYSKLELNADLTFLLSNFPELDNPRDQFSGHSFRAGLSTILSVLGFSEEEIKGWGRWKSEAYIRYLKDQTHRRKVFEKFRNTFTAILRNV